MKPSVSAALNWLTGFSQRTRFILLLTLCTLLMAGCSSFRSHDQLMSTVIQTQNSQGSDAALKRLRKTISTSEENQLLYALEIGEILRQKQDYEGSNQIWSIAEARITQWEQTSILNPERLFSYLGATTLNEAMKPYEGQDFEKTWVSTRIALNHLALNQWDSARVAIKRTHEREAIIATFRAKEMNQVQERAAQQGWNISGAELGNYPIAVIESPEVLNLHNSYQNAFSHYLAGFIYEALGEQSLAAPGYRKAVELSPDASVLKEGLAGLDQRMSQTLTGKNQGTDILFLIESDYAPAIKAFEVNFPFFYRDEEDELQVIYIPISFPVIYPSPASTPVELQLGKDFFTAIPIMNTNLMARRALHDELPQLIFRGLSRAAAKGASQYYANETNSLIGVIVNIFSVITERTDDRSWRTLPGSIALARAHVPAGNYELTIGQKKTPLPVQGKFMLVPIRITTQGVSIGALSSYGETPHFNQQESLPNHANHMVKTDVMNHETR